MIPGQEDNNERVNTFWMEWLAATVATVASLGGVMVAVEQLTAASRLRRRSAFWKEQLHDDEQAEDYDQAVAQSLYLEAIARLVALQAYPGWKTVGWLVCAVASLFGASAMGFDAGSLSISGLTVEMDHWMLFLVCVGGFVVALINTHRVIVRRRSIVNRYLQGQNLTTKGRYERVKSSKESVWETPAVVMFSSGVSFYGFALGFVVGLPLDSVLREYMASFMVLIAGGGLGGLIGLISPPVTRMFNEERIDWEHPRNFENP